MARRFVAELEVEDPQEEVHAWHLAASHILAAQRIGKSRQEDLSKRAERIEVGLAVRLMTLADRKSTALDRHRIARLKPEELAWKQASEASRPNPRAEEGEEGMADVFPSTSGGRDP